MTNDEMTISVIEGMLGLIDNSNDVSRSRLSDFKYWLVELKNIFHDIKDEEPEEEELFVHLVFPDFNLETNKPIPVVDGKVIIKDEVLNDILSFTRKGYIKEDEYKAKINGILVALNRSLNGQ